MCKETELVNNSCAVICIVMMTNDTSVLHRKLLVISRADWRKPDPVTADSWVHVVRSGCPWVNACPWLCAWAISLWPRPLCYNCMEKHYARFVNYHFPAMLLCYCETFPLTLFFHTIWVVCPLSSMFWQTNFITSGNKWQTTSIVHMTTALSCIMEGELLFEAIH